MKINVDSWHYKVYRFYKVMTSDHLRRKYFYGRQGYSIDDDPHTIDTVFDEYCYMPNDFCSYWRGILFWPVINFLLSLTLVISITTLIVALLAEAGGAILVGAGMLVGLLVVVAVILSIVDWLKRKSEQSISDIVKKEDSLFYQVYKSKKEKICPMVEYTKEGE